MTRSGRPTGARRPILLAVLAAMLAQGAPAAAREGSGPSIVIAQQSRGGARPAAPLPAQPPAPPPPAPEPPPPPYEPQVLRLSEILGALSFLRELCSAGDAAGFRARMTALIEAEAPSPARRERLAGAFNKGFSSYALSHRTCTPAAQLAAERSLAEGARLAREITSRYGG